MILHHPDNALLTDNVLVFTSFGGEKPYIPVMMPLREIVSMPQWITAGRVSALQLLRRDIVQLGRRYPRAWLALTLAAAALGYGLVLLFPYLIYAMPMALYEQALAARTAADWIQCGALAILFLVGAAVTWTLFRLRFALPAGRVVSRDEAPALYRMIAELHAEYGKPAIHRVLIDDGTDVRVALTPAGGLSPWTKRTLIIGLPVLQTLSPAQLRVLLARGIGPLSLRNLDLATRLHQLNDLWAQYHGLRHHASPVARLVGRLFSVYAPFYRTLSLGITYHAELHADGCALDIINDEIVVDGISMHTATRHYLEQRYWPTIKRMVASGRERLLPFRHMTDVVKKGLDGQRLDDAVTRLFNEDSGFQASAGFSERLENIGHDRPLPMKTMTTTAGKELLGESLAGIVREFDQHWYDTAAQRL